MLTSLLTALLANKTIILIIGLLGLGGIAAWKVKGNIDNKKIGEAIGQSNEAEIGKASAEAKAEALKEQIGKIQDIEARKDEIDQKLKEKQNEIEKSDADTTVDLLNDMFNRLHK